jgi:hypothetical protein
LFIPDPDPDFFIHPGSRGQKGTGSRIRNTVDLNAIFAVGVEKRSRRSDDGGATQAKGGARKGKNNIKTVSLY